MTAQVIDGVAIAQQVCSELTPRIAALRAKGVTPGLAAVLVGDNPASEIYVSNKTRACAQAGLHSELHRFEASCAEQEVAALIDKLNADSTIHGILVQLPLPAQLNAERLLQQVRFEKDVDGFNHYNLGALVAGRPTLVPCTAAGIMTMLEREDIPVAGRDAVVVGRSVIVGKPTALLLLAQGATVTICTSKTHDLRGHVARADILVVAAGKPRLIDGSMLKPGAVVVDVGINRLADGKLCGDVDFASASAVASRITPVPGGVGRMTVAMLIANTVLAAERIAGGA